jgi:hypothetical protein
MKPFLILLCASLAVTLASCAVRTAKVGQKPGAAATEQSAEELLGILETQNMSVKSMAGKSLVVYRDGDKVVSLKATIAADKEGGRYRLDLFDYVFNKHLMTLIRWGEQVSAILYFKKEYRELSYDDFRFEDMTGITIPKDILLSTMLGEVYLPDGERKVYTGDEPVHYTEAERGARGALKNRVLIIETEPGSRDTILFDDEGIPVEARYSGGPEAHLVRFLKHKNIDGIEFPVKITIESGPRNLEINFTEVKLNRITPENAFTIPDASLQGFARVE